MNLAKPGTGGTPNQQSRFALVATALPQTLALVQDLVATSSWPDASIIGVFRGLLFFAGGD